MRAMTRNPESERLDLVFDKLKATGLNREQQRKGVEDAT